MTTIPAGDGIGGLETVTRPDGRVYRPRKAPEALLTGYDGDVEGVIVLRTHNVEVAQELALDELARYDSAWDVKLGMASLDWGHFRPDRATDGLAWETHADCSGTPAVHFGVLE